MSREATFLSGLCITLAISTAVAVWLRPHLRTILTDLCGTEPRARFWVVFSVLVIVLIPVGATMGSSPHVGIGTVFEVARQVQGGLIWTLVAVGGIGARQKPLRPAGERTGRV